jgi:O-antigen ligase
MVLNWLLEARFIKKLKMIKRDHHKQDTLLFIILYLNYLIGLFYSSNLEFGWFSVQVKLSLFIFPVLFSTINLEFLSKKQIQSVFGAFLVGCVIASLFCLGDAFIKYAELGSIDEFYYINLSIFHHPGYFAMYLSFGVAIMIYYILRGPVQKNWVKVLVVLLIIYFHIFIVLLSSKAGIISLVLIFLLAVSYIVFYKRKYLIGIGVMLIVALLFIVFLKLFPYSINRFDASKTIVDNKEQLTEKTSEGTGERILIWKYSLEIINDHFFFGVGTGDVVDAMLEKYRKKKFTDALNKMLNAHNQYLQTFIALGIIGFLILVLSLLLPAIYSIRSRQFIFFCFLVIVAFNLLFESMFERQAGIVFYGFFNIFLFSIKKEFRS